MIPVLRVIVQETDDEWWISLDFYGMVLGGVYNTATNKWRKQVWS